MNNSVLSAGPSNLGPYHPARYNSLAKTTWSVHVAICQVSEHHCHWNFSEDEISFKTHNLTKNTHKRFLSQRANISKTLDRIQPSIAIFIGYATTSSGLAALECAEREIPRILNIIGNPTKHSLGSQPKKPTTKKTICKALYPSPIVPGTQERQLGMDLGSPKSRIWEVGNILNTAHFSRDRISAPDKQYFCYVGRLSEEKTLVSLLKACSHYQNKGGAWEIKIVDDGPCRDQLKTISKAIPSASSTGRVDHQNLPRLLGVLVVLCYTLFTSPEDWYQTRPC